MTTVRSSAFEAKASHRSRIASRSIMVTVVAISRSIENRRQSSHSVALQEKSDSVTVAPVLSRGVPEIVSAIVHDASGAYRAIISRHCPMRTAANLYHLNHF